jgi:hypothetical protein
MTLSVFDAAREEPKRVAVIADDTVVTYAELASRVEHRLGELLAAGALDERGERGASGHSREGMACVLRWLTATFRRRSEPEF